MKYLVAVDGSEPSMDALRYAVEQAAATGADVTAVSVVVPEQFFTGGDDPPTSYAEAADELVAEDVQDAEEDAQAALEDAAEVGDEAGVEVETGLLYGEPVEVVTEFAEGRGPSSSRMGSDDEEYDAIFVGHRGLSDRYEGLVGSTAKEIVGRATVPVTVVR
ncbi:universal stress protein [Halorussus salinus]|uniref:universal stress protein n=1 Tax=Halorussus salinus TaxID=1364935 RepID=UPI001092568E|nr:universal stress protein [Halorussus salinus]